MSSIEQQLARVDLNLLIPLSILIKEKNVLRAAEKLCISQPAMSRCLQKLRLIFNDSLFHRESTGLQPTVKTLELERHLTPLLESINHFINTEKFEPSLCDRSFSISMPALMSNTLMPPFIKKINQLAPNIIIEQHPAASETERYLENGQFDFSFNIRKTKSINMTSSSCGHTYPVIYARKEHPLSLLDSISIEDCLTYKFLDFISDENTNLKVNNPAKKYFDDHGFELDIAFRSGQVGLLTEMMKQSNHLLIGCHFLMSDSNLANQFDIVYQFNSPEYHIQTYLSDHERSHTNDAHQWLKSILIESIKTSISKYKKNA